MSCFARIDRLNGVEREYQVAVVALRLLREELHNDPSYLRRDELSPRDATRFQTNLEATYLVRIFAEFEAGIRDVWRNAFRRKSRPQMELLLRSVGAIRSVPRDEIDAVDRIRLYRNALVHEGDLGQVQTIPFDRSRGSLCRYFRWMPKTW